MCLVCPPWHTFSSVSLQHIPLHSCSLPHKGSVTFLCRNSSQHVIFLQQELAPVEDLDKSTWVSVDRLHIASLLNSTVAMPEGNLLHDLIICLGLDDDVFFANLLISMYGRCGALLDACAVFDFMSIQNVVSWTALMTCFVKNGLDVEAVQLFKEMKTSGMEPNRVTFLTVLSACTNVHCLSEGRLIHASIIEMGLQFDVTIETALVNMYDKCSSLEDACTVFDRMQSRNVVSWTSMISAYAGHELHKEAVLLFWHMQGDGVEPNEPTFMIVISACASQKVLSAGRLIHALVLLGGVDVGIGVGTALVTMYGKCGAILDAASVFSGLRPRNLISWTAMMTAYGENEQYEDCLLLYKQMHIEGCKPDKVTFTMALNACAGLASLVEGMLIHTSIIYFGFESDVLVTTALVDMYGKSGALLDAFSLFDNVHQRDAVLWSAMISSCISRGYWREGLHLFRQMQEEGVEPDEVAYLSVLGACDSPDELGEGRNIHSCFTHTGLSLDLVGSGLITMYANCGALENACLVFQAMQFPDVVTFNATITAFVQHGLEEKALELFSTMQLGGYDTDDVTFINILTACAGLSALRQGRRIHCSIIEAGFQSGSLIENPLLNFYGKTGALEDVHVMFNKSFSHSTLSWTIVMTAYAQHGLGKEVLYIFAQMQEEGVMPDEVTLISLLSACSHAGMVDAGFDCFVLLSNYYGVGLTVDHFVCLVDLVGRAGRLSEAECYLSNFPFEISSAHWSSLLRASAIHNNLDLGRRAATYMLDLDTCLTPLSVWTTAETIWD